MTQGRTRRKYLAGFLALLFVASSCIVGLFVWVVTHRSGGGSLFADRSAYSKCNGLDKLARQNIGAIPVTYQLIDKRYTCRGFRGNTPQRVTEITYTYVASSPAPKPKANEPLDRYLSVELARAGWATPGVARIDGQTTALHLTKDPLIGVTYRTQPSRVAIFQLAVFARDAWQPPVQDERAPQEMVIARATVQKYIADLTALKPTFVPTGYRLWFERPYQDEDALDPRDLTSVRFVLSVNTKGDLGVVQPEVALTQASADQYAEACRGDLCTKIGKNSEGRPIFSTKDGNTIYSQLGETFVTIDQLTNRYNKPIVGPQAGVQILASMQARK